MVHILVVGQSDEAPCGYTFRQCELQGHPSAGIRLERRIEEGCLAEVLAHLRTLLLCVLFLLIFHHRTRDKRFLLRTITNYHDLIKSIVGHDTFFHGHRCRCLRVHDVPAYGCPSEIPVGIQFGIVAEMRENP